MFTKKDDGSLCWNNRVLGFLDFQYGEKCFITMRIPAIHWFRKGKGYALNQELLNYLENEGIELIVIKENGKRGIRILTATVAEYQAGQKVKEGGFEEQKVIPSKNMKVREVYY